MFSPKVQKDIVSVRNNRFPRIFKADRFFKVFLINSTKVWLGIHDLSKQFMIGKDIVSSLVTSPENEMGLETKENYRYELLLFLDPKF